MARVQYSAAARGQRKTAEIPERLATWYVDDDWVSDDEQPPPHVIGKQYLDDKQLREELAMARILLSRRRFIAARADYARQVEAAGGTPPTFPRVGQPRRRNPLPERTAP